MCWCLSIIELKMQGETLKKGDGTSDIRHFLYMPQLLLLSKCLAMKLLTYANENIFISHALTAALAPRSSSCPI